LPTENQLTHVNKKKSRVYKKKRGSRSHGLKGCPFKEGFCLKVRTMKPKKPNSAIRKITKVKLTTGRKVNCYIHGSGHNLREFSHVLVRGRFVQDLPGIQYHLVKGKYDFSWKERVLRTQKRSKFGIPKDA